MGFLPLSFAMPAVLAGLIALPVIWWLLRLTPPKPQTEAFPPLKILARVLRKEETPHQSPWWLTLLRLLMAALIIFALAQPVLNPRERVAIDGGAVAIVVDNGWASAPDWDVRVATAERMIADAEAQNAPVVLAFTADADNTAVGPFDPQEARERLNAAGARPVPVDRGSAFARVADALGQMPGATVAMLSDGLASDADEDAFATLLADAGNLIWAAPQGLAQIGLMATANEPDAFLVEATRATNDTGLRQATVAAFDDRGRRIAEAPLSFAAGEAIATAEIRVPFELRNDFNSVAVDGQLHAGAVRVLDENSRRRRVGLIAQGDGDVAQPLLSPLHYIGRALDPFADLIEPASADLASAIPQLLEQHPAMIVMADVGNLPAPAHDALVEWVEGGGTLVRFAGPRLAASEPDEDLLPVRLRTGERALGGTLSWTEPQAIAEYPEGSPFADLTPPTDVTVSRQVLAEPAADIVERSWVNLADGTPLVTGARRGEGTVALFHVAPQATWSNLPISGTFVELLRRLVQLSRNQGAAATTGADQTSLPPYRLIAADGGLVPPTPDARPLVGTDAPVTIENPPGLYGSDEGVVAHNLLPADAMLEPLARPQTPMPVTDIAYGFDRQVDLRGPLFAAALALMILDTLAVLWLGGRLRRRPRLAQAASVALAIVVLAAGPVPDAHAQENDARPGDEEAIDAISQTRIAYVLTGNSSIDAISRAGLEGLGRFLIDKTALEPGAPVGVDIAEDELAFYPLIYWPIDEGAPMPSPEALARVDAYMQEGGTVLFDTRDQFGAGFDAGAASGSTLRLREILADMSVPPLEPVPQDHVLTKTFYILPEFPGRFNGSPLWVEASQVVEETADRPVRVGDGVTPIMITANDFAGAWAVGASGAPMLPTVPADPMQRAYAYRAGVNIMMYMLTGNYKSDQVHVPSILERLGQ
ncbi:DUF4159 domain-containing protein [Aliihoeflea aestuarii]|uniref:DUF4159 domain-containing protein n=1 Tax=Aliihoeflea aestuarii TaxID=453840 RepID=UPI002094730B|nr:DUF4159 domain-containing protein [Aliihoeflea aestuarii]MCO6393364.1 DUF4159 domain-containing protein [Aliihoeflea aestuarii]